MDHTGVWSIIPAFDRISRAPWEKKYLTKCPSSVGPRREHIAAVSFDTMFSLIVRDTSVLRADSCTILKHCFVLQTVSGNQGWTILHIMPQLTYTCTQKCVWVENTNFLVYNGLFSICVSQTRYTSVISTCRLGVAMSDKGYHLSCKSCHLLHWICHLLYGSCHLSYWSCHLLYWIWHLLYGSCHLSCGSFHLSYMGWPLTPVVSLELLPVTAIRQGANNFVKVSEKVLK